MEEPEYYPINSYSTVGIIAAIIVANLGSYYLYKKYMKN
jgi:hypothetical protein